MIDPGVEKASSPHPRPGVFLDFSLDFRDCFLPGAVALAPSLERTTRHGGTFHGQRHAITGSLRGHALFVTDGPRNGARPLLSRQTTTRFYAPEYRIAFEKVRRR